MGGTLPGAVLFACTENAIRSPMASAIYKAAYGDKSYVQSAGIRRGEINPFMVEVTREIGIDLSHHKPQTLADLQDSLFDIIITLSPEAHHQAMEMTRTMAVDVEYWPVMDPTLIDGNREQRLAAYRDCRDILSKKIKQRFGG
jgi:protein-tyrosine-phosphatase